MVKTIRPMRKIVLLLLLLIRHPGIADDQGQAFYWRGALYQDWMGFQGKSETMFSQLSTRLHLTLWNRPGDGWTINLDLRNRLVMNEGGGNSLMVYNAYLAYDAPGSRFFLSLGQMNLYDTAGTGQLAGVLAGFKLNRNLSAGAYGGLETDIYNTRTSFNYQKFGVYFRYLGQGARQFSLSYNLVRFKAITERQFLLANALMPLGKILILYGNMEIEMDPLVKPADRLSQLFVNARANLTRYADITASYSSGRGMDYHQFLLEQSQDPSLQNSTIERFYYNKSYGVRFNLKPGRNLRLHISRQESELADLGIRNHTLGFGFSIAQILKSGISLYGNYNLNRGGSSEADTYYLSASRSFGKLAWTLSYANFYNGVLFSGNGSPQVIRIKVPDQHTISTDLFLILSRSLAISLDYSYLQQTEYFEHQLFMRLILRK